MPNCEGLPNGWKFKIDHEFSLDASNKDEYYLHLNRNEVFYSSIGKKDSNFTLSWIKVCVFLPRSWVVLDTTFYQTIYFLLHFYVWNFLNILSLVEVVKLMNTIDHVDFPDFLVLPEPPNNSNLPDLTIQILVPFLNSYHNTRIIMWDCFVREADGSGFLLAKTAGFTCYSKILFLN